VPGFDGNPAALARFAEGCSLLADFAATRMIRLSVEAFPGRSLPSAAATLDWLQQVGHPNLALLLDLGHCLISREDPARVIEQAGPLLGYVHLDDNDGVNDVHWPLLSGRLTDATLRTTVAALRAADYREALELELSPKNAEPVAAARQGKELMEKIFTGA